MHIKKIHHVACRCIDAKQTVERYVETGEAPQQAAWLHATPEALA